MQVLCRALEVSRSGYYAARRRPLSPRAHDDVRLTRRLRVLHAASRRTYGRPRLHRALRAEGLRVGEKRVRRLMRTAVLHAKGRRRFRLTTDSTHPYPVTPNHLARRFTVAAPNTVWAADITALWTREGWCYLAVVLDLASRRVVGWALRPTLETALVLAALHLALGRRPVRPGLIHHSDRGGQYASAAYQQLLASHGIIPSMSRVGDCWDNARSRASSAGSRPNCCPTIHGPHARRPTRRSRITSSISIIASACIPQSATGRPRTSKQNSEPQYDSPTLSTKTTQRHFALIQRFDH